MPSRVEKLMTAGLLRWRAAEVKQLLLRTAREVNDDNCLGLAAQLAFYFLLSLFPALIVLVSLIAYVPLDDVMTELLAPLSAVAPPEALRLVRGQLEQIAAGERSGLLTLGILGAIWSSSAAVVAIIDTLNRAYDIEDGRPWWKRRILAIVLTIALAVLVIVTQASLLLGPWLIERLSAWTGVSLNPFWWIARWSLTLLLPLLAMDLVYYFAPHANLAWRWLSPGAILATTLWVASSLGFRFYVQNFGDFGATYGTLGGAMVLMMWFYVSAFAILVGAELNAEIRAMEDERRGRDDVRCEGSGEQEEKQQQPLHADRPIREHVQREHERRQAEPERLARRLDARLLVRHTDDAKDGERHAIQRHQDERVHTKRRYRRHHRNKPSR